MSMHNACGPGQDDKSGVGDSRSVFPATELGGEACRRPTLLPMLAVRSHVPSRCVFLKTHLLPTELHTSYLPKLEFLQKTSSILSPRQNTMKKARRKNWRKEFLMIFH